MVWIQCGAHAREWISIATCMYILDKMTSEGPIKKHLLKKYDIYIMPIVNPDGYTFTWKSGVIYLISLMI